MNDLRHPILHRAFTFFSLCAAAVLYLSVLYCGTPLEKLLGSLLASFGLLMLAVDTAPTKRNMSRHWTSKYSRTSRSAFLNLAVPFACYAAAAAAILSLAVYSAASSAKNPEERLLADSSNPCAITLAERKALASDSAELIEMRPIFGWGSASFPNVFAFKQGGDLGSSAWISPCSDLIQKLVEGGLFGLALLFVMPLAFFVRWLARWDFSVSALVMFAACAAVAALSVADYPFQSIAVQSGFWIILMSAFRWDDADVR